mgnify:CR=1 FL=1
MNKMNTNLYTSSLFIIIHPTTVALLSYDVFIHRIMFTKEWLTYAIFIMFALLCFIHIYAALVE